MRGFAGSLGAFFLIFLGALETQGAQLITNGGFETGTLAGWTAADLPGSSGPGFVVAGGLVTPTSGMPTVGPASGVFYAVSDQSGPGTHALIQSFTVPSGATSVILSFNMFVNDWSNLGPIFRCSAPGPGCLDFAGPANQHGHVDILFAGVPPFDTDTGILTSLYSGVDPGPDPNGYTSYVFDITAAVGGGGTFQIRFVEVDNQLFLNLGIDDVSIVARTEAPTVPTPTSLLLIGVGLLAAGIARARRGT